MRRTSIWPRVPGKWNGPLRAYQYAVRYFMTSLSVSVATRRLGCGVLANIDNLEDEERLARSGGTEISYPKHQDRKERISFGTDSHAYNARLI